eukprot:6896090-Ditylum_brightwellii.AAC.1
MVHHHIGEGVEKDGHLSWNDGNRICGSIYGCFMHNFVMWKNLGQMPNCTNLLLYPDGNQTRDQTRMQDKNSNDGAVYLVRTYYAPIEYVLPSPVMQ